MAHGDPANLKYELAGAECCQEQLQSGGLSITGSLEAQGCIDDLKECERLAQMFRVISRGANQAFIARKLSQGVSTDANDLIVDCWIAKS